MLNFSCLIQVTVLHNNYNYNQAPHENLTLLRHRLQGYNNEKVNFFDLGTSLSTAFGSSLKSLWDLSRDLYTDPLVQDLYKRKDEFDVVLLDAYMNEVIKLFRN